MRLQVKGKNVEVSDSLKTYAQEKLGKLDKHLNDGARLELELAVEKNPSISENQIAEGTIWTKGPVLRARETSADMRASIDLLVEKLERQARRYRDKRRITMQDSAWRFNKYAERAREGLPDAAPEAAAEPAAAGG